MAKDDAKEQRDIQKEILNIAKDLSKELENTNIGCNRGDVGR